MSSHTPSRPSEWFQQQRAKASIREAAKLIFRKLEKWDADKESAKAKWVWELIQNARDVAKNAGKESFKVSIFLDKNRVIFQHDAGPFSLSNISSLLNARSDKPMGSHDVVGEFGKGFLVTHVLSGKVNIRGWVKDDAISINRSFEIPLDRTFQTSDELTVEYIVKNIDDCEKKLDKSEVPLISSDIAEFEYLLDKEGYEIAVDGLRALENVLPFILAFTEPNMEVKIFRNSQERRYKVLNRKAIVSKPFRIEQLTMENQGSHQMFSSLILVSTYDSEVKIAVPISNHAICELGDVPRLFWMFPLLKTKDLELPIVIYAPFRVSEDRFNIQYGDQHVRKLENILQTAKTLMMELSKWTLKNDIEHKEQLFKIKAPPNDTPCRIQWIQALSMLAIELSQLKIVEVVKTMIDDSNYDKEFLEPESVYFPSPLVGSDSFDDEKFLKTIWWLSYHLGLRVPTPSLVKEWNDIRAGWKDLSITVGNDQTFENIVKEIETLKSLATLKRSSSVETDRNALDLLKYLYKLGQYYNSERRQIPEFLGRAIYCDQNGDFKRRRELSIDKNIPDDLKKISDNLFEPLCKRLLYEEFSKGEGLKQYFQDLGMTIMDEGGAINELYSKIHRNWKQRIKSFEIDRKRYKQGVMEFEKWLLEKENFETLLGKYPLRELPFLCEDEKLRVSGEEYFIPPKLFLEEDAQEHISIWPEDKRLSKEYSEGITSLNMIKEHMVVANIIKPNILFYEEMELSLDQMKEMSDIRIRGSWKAKTKVSQVVAFDKALMFAGQSMNNERTKGILEFMLGYLVPRDDLWGDKPVKAEEMTRPALAIPQPTGKTRDYSLYPCLWLAQIKRHKWVIDISTDDKGDESLDAELPSKDSLTEYLKVLKPSILDNERVQTFLQLRFGFSPLEMTSWLLTEGRLEAEQTLVECLKQIHKLSSIQGIDSLESLTDIISEFQMRSLRAQVTNRNRNFGLIIEAVVRKVFENLKFKEYGFLVKPRFKGYDFEAYLQRIAIEESDYGILSINVERIKDGVILARFEVEVKATRVDTVTMTLTQAERAVDNVEKYLLCVVDAKDLAKLVELDSPSLNEEQIEKLSKKIPPYMKIVNIGEELGQVVTDFRKASLATPDIRVDYQAKFNIHSKLWKTKGETISGWFNSILRRFGVSTD